MKIGVLGTGMVGATIGTKLVELGHEAMMGSRSKDNEKAAAWAKSAGPRHRTAHSQMQRDLVKCSSTARTAWRR